MYCSGAQPALREGGGPSAASPSAGGAIAKGCTGSPGIQQKAVFPPGKQLFCCRLGGARCAPRSGSRCYDSRFSRLQPEISEPAPRVPPFPLLPCLRLTHSSSISYTVLSSINNLYHMVCSSPLVRFHRGGPTGVPPYHNICKALPGALILQKPRMNFSRGSYIWSKGS